MTFELAGGDFEPRAWQTATEGTVRFALIGVGWWTTKQAIPALDESELAKATVLVSGSRAKGGTGRRSRRDRRAGHHLR